MEGLQRNNNLQCWLNVNSVHWTVLLFCAGASVSAAHVLWTLSLGATVGSEPWVPLKEMEPSVSRIEAGWTIKEQQWSTLWRKEIQLYRLPLSLCVLNMFCSPHKCFTSFTSGPCLMDQREGPQGTEVSFFYLFSPFLPSACDAENRYGIES